MLMVLLLLHLQYPNRVVCYTSLFTGRGGKFKLTFIIHWFRGLLFDESIRCLPTARFTRAKHVE